jgi:hypothetical protein
MAGGFAMLRSGSAMVVGTVVFFLLAGAGATPAGGVGTPAHGTSAVGPIPLPNLGARAPGVHPVANFSGNAWQAWTPPAGFPTLVHASVASDSADDLLLVFGGCIDSTCSQLSNATWVESNGSWTQLHPALAPSPREEAQMAWDPADGYVLLFGGLGCQDPPACTATGPLNDTWAFRAGTWNPVVPSGVSPPPTYQGALAYDPSDRLMVLFGGFGCTTGCYTWTYSAGTWSEPSLPTAPPFRYGDAFSEDDAAHGAVLFGGTSATGSALSDTWVFSAAAWHEQSPVSAPGGRTGAVLSWDPGLGAAVLFGGQSAAGGSAPVTLYNDTWAFVGGNWTQWSGAAPPSAVIGAGFAEDPSTGNLLLVGGCDVATCPTSAAWAFGPVNSVVVNVEAHQCAAVSLGGSALASGVADELENGTYPLVLTACSGYQLVNVTASPALTLNATNQTSGHWTGSLQVRGAGAITANLTHVATPPPPGLLSSSFVGLTFLELLLIVVAFAAVVGVSLAVRRSSRRRTRPPPSEVSSTSRPKNEADGPGPHGPPPPGD